MTDEVGDRFPHQVVDRLTLAIIRYVAVQLASDAAFDPVVVRTVRRQEVQSESPAVIAEPPLCTLAAVDRVVVQHDMDDFPLWVLPEQRGPGSLRPDEEDGTMFPSVGCQRHWAPGSLQPQSLPLVVDSADDLLIFPQLSQPGVAQNLPHKLGLAWL